MGGGKGQKLRHRERYTLTLVIVVIVFVVSELPDLFLRSWILVRQIWPEHVPFPLDELRVVNAVSNLCLTANSSVNFVIYCLVGQRFRVEMLRLFCRGSSSSPMMRRAARHRRDDAACRTRSARLTEPIKGCLHLQLLHDCCATVGTV